MWQCSHIILLVIHLLLPVPREHLFNSLYKLLIVLENHAEKPRS